jgi:hypothetical protein
MVRNILPLATLALVLGAAPAFAADTALNASLATRVAAAAEKACVTQVYDGPKHLFYPISYKAEHDTCVRLVTRQALKQIAAASFAQVAQK